MMRRTLLIACAFFASSALFLSQNVFAGGHESPIPPTQVAETPGLTDEDVIVVIGGSGRTGQRTVQQLVDAGVNVRATTRDIAKASAEISADFNWVTVDVTQPETISAALDGATYVISTIGNGQMPEQIDYQGVVNIVDAAVAAETIKHMTLVSSAGVTHKDHYLNKMLNNVLQWKLKGENHLRTSGLNYTVVRPYGLQDELDVSSKFASILMDQGDDIMPNGIVSRVDVAKVSIASLTNPDANRKTFEITNYFSFEPNKWEIQFGLMAADQGPVSVSD